MEEDSQADNMGSLPGHGVRVCARICGSAFVRPEENAASVLTDVLCRGHTHGVRVVVSSRNHPRLSLGKEVMKRASLVE